MPMKKRAKQGPFSKPRGRPSNVPYGIRDLYRYRRTELVQTVQGGTSVVTGALSLTVAQINASMATFLTQWDICRFNSIRVRFAPRAVINTVNSGFADGQIPSLAWVPNYDDFAAPASFDVVLAQRGSKTRKLDREISVVVHPRALTMISVSSGSSGNVALMPEDTWFNTGALINQNFQIPLCKYAIQGVPGLIGQGNVDVFFDIDMTLAHSIG